MCISKIHDQQQTHVHPTLETPRRDGKDLAPSHNSYALCAGCVATRQKSTVLLTWVLLQEHPTSWFQFPQWGTGTSGFATDGHNSVEATAHTVQQEALGHDGLLVILCKGCIIATFLVRRTSRRTGCFALRVGVRVSLRTHLPGSYTWRRLARCRRRGLRGALLGRQRTPSALWSQRYPAFSNT